MLMDYKGGELEVTESRSGVTNVTSINLATVTLNANYSVTLQNCIQLQ
jgi:hypothetical protein